MLGLHSPTHLSPAENTAVISRQPFTDIPPIVAESIEGPPVPPPLPFCLAEPIEEEVQVVVEHSLPLRIWLAIGSGLEWLFGLVSLLVTLAFVAAVPIVQFVSLGYLLESSGRIARTGRFREGFVGIRQIGRVGSIVLGTWLMLWPLRFLSDMWYSAQLMAPEGRPTTVLRFALLFLTSVFILHVLLAWYCGGKLRHFFWPFLAPFFFAMWMLRLVIASATLRPIVRPIVGTISRRLLNDLTTVPSLNTWFPPAILLTAWRKGGLYSQARDAVWEFVIGLRLPYFFSLGARGFIGAVAWLFVPAIMMIGMTKLPALVTEAGADLKGVQFFSGIGGVSSFFGSLLMALVIVHLPFLQTHFAAENRLSAIFEVRTVWRMFRRAPIAFWFALFITMLFAVPLYLLKIEYTPRELLWLPSLIFVLFIYPARLLTGWAVARARKRDKPRFFLSWLLAPLVATPLVFFYVVILFFTQYISWDGAWSLLEQHPFLLPAPFFGL